MSITLEKGRRHRIFHNPKRPVILSEAKNLWLFETAAPQHKTEMFHFVMY